MKAMKNKKTKIKYDPEADVLSLEKTAGGKIDYASEIGNFVVHFTKDNKPVYFGVLEASKFFKSGNKLIKSPFKISRLAHSK